MPKVLFYTDPHIGLTRRANYTESSSKAREAWVRGELTKLLQDSSDAGHTHRFCLGDFFDRESVSEQTILDSLPIANLTDGILCGNHDAVNRLGQATSFHLLAEVIGPKAMRADFTENVGFVAEIGASTVYFAPHVLTQTAYESMIDDLRLEAAKFTGYKVLCLHCNYDLSPPLLTEATLNLTQELAYSLLADFHYILLGHIHSPQDLCDGRIKIIGSCQPTAFDNMDSKRALVYDTETGEFTNLTTWDAEENYYYGPASEIPPNVVQYYELMDDLPTGEAQKVVVDLFKAGAFGVRLVKPTSVVEDKAISVAQLMRLPETIATELREQRPHLVPLWEEISNEQ